MATQEAMCPVCKRNPKVEAYKPFCSKRCADVDLQRWLVGSYVLPETDEAVPDNDPENDD
ncbi:DNA gyrase inhibitor YacG [Brevundimonas sp. NIBR11]|uniref:DNA gyrase inhibitor YacG n=1 Tax=Brevundimonas sp. NIBR11 TaxID=3015999 RepID=UPI0022EFDFE5|nr:DNA gyrase inhibitor YacG [Brevundimonas sp. NIBR11]WGM30650.1 DNA gyrase inhibitor YacG [Brevundimonas sp. NIBR11]